MRVLLILFAISQCVSINFDDEIVNFVADTFYTIFAPSIITAFVCIEKDRKGILTMEFSKKRIFINFRDHNGNYSEALIFQERRHQHLFLSDLDCSGHEKLMKMANSSKMLGSPFKWLIITDRIDQMNDKNASLLTNQFIHMAIFPASDVVIAERLKKDYIKISSIYRPSTVRNFILEDRGYWNKQDGVFLYNGHPNSRRRRNLFQTPLKSCLVMTQPDTVNHLTDYVDSHRDSITKCNYPWAIFLANMMNATVSFVTTNTWGYIEKNGSWGGMIGMLERGEIDFGGTGSFVVKERIGVVEYINLYVPISAKFIFRRPPLSSMSNLFAQAFDKKVWIAVVGAMALSFILLHFGMNWEHRRISETKKESLLVPGYVLPKPTFSDEYLVLLGAVTQQGFSYEARIISTRIIVLIILLASLNLYSAYTAHIVVLLQSTTTSITTLKDLLHSPLTLAANGHISTRHYIKTYTDPVRRAIYEQRIEPKGYKHNWLPVDEGVRRMRDGYFAYHSETSVIYKIMQKTYEEDEKCGLQEIDFFNTIYPHFVIKMNSPYSELFKVGALRILETGMRSREITRLLTPKPVCSSTTRFVSVGLSECYAAFVILGSAFALAFALFVAELIGHKTIHKQNLIIEIQEETIIAD